MEALATWETSRRTRKACGIVLQQQGGTAPTRIRDTQQVSYLLHFTQFTDFFFHRTINILIGISGVREGGDAQS